MDEGARTFSTIIVLSALLLVAAIALLPIPTANASVGQWVPTAPLSTPRVFHTATLLSDGRILVAGGVGPADVVLSSAELYDPVTESWSSTGSMNGARWLQRSVLLSTGQVLVVGGASGTSFPSPKQSDFLKSAELYDPATGSWSLTGSMQVGRSSDLLVLLQDGRPMYLGGTTVGGTLVEVYDPGSGSWSSGGNLIIAQADPAGAVLSDGRVLVAGGGLITGLPTSVAEICDPSTSSCLLTGSLPQAKGGADAVTLASGMVLVPGGLTHAPTTILQSVLLFDPSSGTFSSTGSMATPRYHYALTLLDDGKALITGGFFDFALNAPTALTEVYDPSTGIWFSTGSMSVGRVFHTATLLTTGEVLVTGGFTITGGSGVTSSADVLTRIVDIDIKPGDAANCFNNDGNGVIPVAILGSADLDVTDVDPGSVQLAGMGIKIVGKSNRLLAAVEDTNGDGFLDLVVKIQDQDGVFEAGETTATLSGSLFDGTPFTGSDSICIVP